MALIAANFDYMMKLTDDIFDKIIPTPRIEMYIPIPGERTYRDLFGARIWLKTEPYDDGDGALMAELRFGGCARAMKITPTPKERD